MKTLSEAIKYSKYSWNICEDLRMISLLLGLQLVTLQLMKHFFKAMDHHGNGFQYLLKKLAPRRVMPS